MSRGYYGVFNDTIYEIEMSKAKPLEVILARDPDVTSRTWNGAELDVNIHLSNLKSGESATNEEMFQAIVDKIDHDQLTELTKLGNEYEMYIEYELDDYCTGEVMDAGSLIKEITLTPALFPLGLTDTNEFVTRYVMSSGQVKFTRNYRRSSPIGINRSTRKARGRFNYALYIKRIYINQVTAIDQTKELEKGDDYFALSKDFPPAPHKGLRDIYPAHPDYYYTHDQEVMRHPSRYYSAHHIRKNEQTVTIYDSDEDEITINPIYFSDFPNQISIHVQADLNNYTVVADKNDVQSHLDANATPVVDDSTTTTEPSDDKSGLEDDKTNPDDNGVVAPSETPDETEKPETPDTSETGDDKDSNSSENGTEETPSGNEDNTDTSEEKGESGGEETKDDTSSTTEPADNESEKEKTDENTEPSTEEETGDSDESSEDGES